MIKLRRSGPAGSTVNRSISVVDLYSIISNISNITHANNVTLLIPVLASILAVAFVVILVRILLWLPIGFCEFGCNPSWQPMRKVVNKSGNSKFGKEHWWSKSEEGVEKPASVAKLLAYRTQTQIPKPTMQYLQYNYFKEGSQPIEVPSSDDYRDAIHELSEVERNLQRAKTWRFICISGIVLSIVTIYVFMPLELGFDSSLGLVKMHDVNNKRSTQWIINIGGTRENNYTQGLHVPFYVFIFGILGGYLRYLYITAYPEEEDPKKPEEIEDLEDLMKQIDKAIAVTNEFLRYTIGKLALNTTRYNSHA